jgi:hypothetical protein
VYRANLADYCATETAASERKRNTLWVTERRAIFLVHGHCKGSRSLPTALVERVLDAVHRAVGAR